MKKRIAILALTLAMLFTLVGGVLPTSALWVKNELTLGDADGNGEVTTNDARTILQYAAELITEDELNLTLANVDGEEEVTTADARMILQYAAELIDGFEADPVYEYTFSGPETTPNPNPETFSDKTAGNPFITDKFTADPSAHVWNDGRLYVYPSNDVFPAQGCDRMDKYHIYSTDNMVDWVDHGQILESKDVLWSNCNGFMWAPDCAYIEATDTYYYFFPHPLTDDQIKNHTGGTDRGWNYSWVMGVAKSVGNPTGPFENLGFVKLADGLVTAEELAATSPVVMAGDKRKSQLTGWFDAGFFSDLKARDGKTLGDHGVSGAALGGYSVIDPCVFVDDDGTVYMSYGGGSGCFVVELDVEKDLLEAKTLPVKLEGLKDFHEGSWLFKRPDSEDFPYWMVYADNTAGQNQMRVAVAQDPMGPYTTMNRPILTGTGCDTSHGSMAMYKGQWYLFYHNCAISGQGNLRSICVDLVTFDQWNLPETVKQTKTSVPAVGPAASTEGGVGGSIIPPISEFTVKTDYSIADCELRGASRNEDKTEIKNMHYGEATAKFKNVDGGKGGKALLTITYSSEGGGATKVGSSADKSGDGYFLKLNRTGSWDTPATVNLIIDLDPGKDNVVTLYGGAAYNIKGVSVSLLP